MFINNLHLTLCIDLSSYDVIFVINTWIISSEKEQTLKKIKKKKELVWGEPKCLEKPYLRVGYM